MVILVKLPLTKVITYQSEGEFISYLVGQCGMGTSKPEYDYCHRVVAGLEEKVRKSKSCICQARVYFVICVEQKGLLEKGGQCSGQ